MIVGNGVDVFPRPQRASIVPVTQDGLTTPGPIYQEGAMSFFDKARQAAEQTRLAATQGIAQATSPGAKEQMQHSATEVSAQLRDAASRAGKGMVSAVSKIDPAILADIIIKATAIQEKANRSLKTKRSAYRIAEITITATIPPQIGFSIARIADSEIEGDDQTVDSQELVETVPTGDEEVSSLEKED